MSGACLRARRSRVERWRRIAREASEQSRRLSAPEIAAPVKLADLLKNEALRDESIHRVWLDEQAGAQPLVDVFRPAGGDATALIIGPEGGWTDPERAAFGAGGWVGASLGHSILRAETAACAALAVIAQLYLAGTSPHGR